MLTRKKRVGNDEVIEAEAVARLADLIKSAEHCVIVTGAGISTNSGLRDYRGPNGIWTEAQEKGLIKGEPGERALIKAGIDCPWDDDMYRLMPLATPTMTHRVVTQVRHSPPNRRPCGQLPRPCGHACMPLSHYLRCARVWSSSWSVGS